MAHTPRIGYRNILLRSQPPEGAEGISNTFFDTATARIKMERTGSPTPITIDPNASGGSFPMGIIVMWSGLRVNVPSGWYLCDGDNGTPDLRDKFICSVTGVEEAGVTGGSSTLTHAGTGVSDHAAQTHAGSAVADHAAQTHTGTAIGDHAALTHSGSAVDNHAALVHANTAVGNHTNVTVPATATAAGKVGTSTANLATNAHTHTIATITHAVTQPSDHAALVHDVTQPSQHAALVHGVTQPSQHAALVHGVTQPSDHPILAHIVTQPSDHTGVSPPYYKLCFIMKGA